MVKNVTYQILISNSLTQLKQYLERMLQLQIYLLEQDNLKINNLKNSPKNSGKKDNSANLKKKERRKL